jgi:hypothetical protein
MGAGGLDRLAGLNGVVLLTSSIIAAVFAWTFRLMVKRGTNVLVALILVLLAASASMIHFLARPHVASWLFAVAWFWILESSEKDEEAPDLNNSVVSRTRNAGKRLFWMLPLMMLVWVNLHGGFLIGFALLAIYWVSAAWERLRLRSTFGEARFEKILRRIRAGRRLRALTFTGILCAAATLMNPYGVRLHVHIYRYLSNRFLMDHIDEFQSPNFHYVAQKCFAGLLLLTLVALAAKRRRVGASQGLVVLFAVYSGLYASRNIPVSSLLLILVIGPRLSEVLTSFAESPRADLRSRSLPYKKFLQRMETIELSMRGHLWPIVAIVLAGVVVAHGGKVDDTTLMDAHFDAKRFPATAVDSIEKQNLEGPISSPDYWGGYLIYRLYPRTKVVIDDRHDFYGEKFLKSYLRMVRVEPGWEDFLQSHEARIVLVPKDSALSNILSETASWKAIYSDNVAVMYVPATP